MSAIEKPSPGEDTLNIDTHVVKERQDSANSVASTTSTLAHDGEGICSEGSTEGSDRNWTPDKEKAEEGRPLSEASSAQTLGESMPWYREVLFVGTICLSQLFTRKCSEN